MKSEQQTIEYFWDYIAKKISRYINDMRNFISLILILAFIIYQINNMFNIGYDSTDSEIHGRSGFTLHVDDMTGCHYLSSCDGGIVKRFDSLGNHICTGYE